MKNLSFLEWLETLASRWYFLVAGMIVGGLLGWGAAMLKAPVYEANAVFTITIDYTQTGALSDIEEDQAMRGVGDIIFSEEVISSALARLEAEGLTLSKDEFYDDAIFDREEFRWAIRYRDADPQLAYQVLHAWEAAADEILQDSLVHARLGAAYQEVLNGLTTCLERGTLMEAGGERCSLENLDEILEKTNQVSGLITDELAQSRGLFSALTVVLSNPVTVPTLPVRFQTNVLVFSGLFIGGLLSIIGLTLLTRKQFVRSDE
ncbi:hypothetical protein [Pelolinea submarina]|uniref:Subunit length determinant protein n=1 Tax=Pelolinea submarina TaxID=913107 RepID=A0A347ZSI0_9CHLR|nr:hypothetical protein [Pelolinea submarina]REG11172.1 hypothetical protein DFR64_1049 [Pelolinea submarina]BBB48261.1 hypothetical protein Pelsub_P1489 [Pelolinea submarina]